MTETPDPFTILATACYHLKLKPTERRVLHNCLWAQTQVPNGYFLTPPRTVASVERLIERGYLAKAPKQLKPFGPKGFGVVVVLEQAHFTKLIEDARSKAT